MAATRAKTAASTKIVTLCDALKTRHLHPCIFNMLSACVSVYECARLSSSLSVFFHCMLLLFYYYNAILFYDFVVIVTFFSNRFSSSFLYISIFDRILAGSEKKGERQLINFLAAL